MIISRQRQFVAACIALSIFGAAMVSGVSVASAQDQPAPVTTPTQVVDDDDHVIVETFTPRGGRISTVAFDESGTIIPVPESFESQGTVTAESTMTTVHVNSATPYSVTGQRSNSGDGGSSSASGCRRVTVSNEKESLLGFTLFWFHTWTSWCWDRNARTISSVSTGWYLSGVDGTRQWNSMIVDNTRYYQWIPGYSTSGYEHQKQGHLQSCPSGCIINNYPQNWLWSHSDGTWSWETDD